MIFRLQEGFYPIEGKIIVTRYKSICEVLLLTETKKIRYQLWRFDEIIFSCHVADILNFEKAKRLGTSQSAEMKPRDMLLRYYEKKLKVYAKTSLGVAASRLILMRHVTMELYSWIFCYRFICKFQYLKMIYIYIFILL